MKKILSKVEFASLVELESNLGLWKIKYKSTPLWHYVRDYYTSSTAQVPRNDKFPGLISVWKSIQALLRARNNPNLSIAFISDRNELIDQLAVIKKQRPLMVFSDSDRMEEFNSIGIFFYLRAVIYLGAPVVLPLTYQRLVRRMTNCSVSISVSRRAARSAMSETIYLNILSRILRGRSREVFYSGVVVPGIERYYNILNSTELQHGIIHMKHPTYAYLGCEVKNRLSVYRKHYVEILDNVAFSGDVRVNDIARISDTGSEHQKRSGSKNLVVYTQPVKEYQELVNQFLENSSEDIRIILKRHPRDYFNYYTRPSIEIADHLDYESVDVAICYTSSVLEPLMDRGKKIVVPQFQAEGIDFNLYFDVYRKHHNFFKCVRFAPPSDDFFDDVKAYYAS